MLNNKTRKVNIVLIIIKITHDRKKIIRYDKVYIMCVNENDT